MSSDDAVGEPGASRWCVVANVVAERLHGETAEVRHGTKHFTGGTKVYFHSAYWGMGGESVTVVGRGRGGKRWITVTLDARFLENWRAKVVYEPAVLRLLADDEIQGDETKAREHAEFFAGQRGATRLRLVERSLEQALVIASAMGEEPAIHATLAGPAPSRATVLYEGTRPVAVLGFDASERSTGFAWKQVWIAGDRPELLADLVYAVHNRYRERWHTGGDALIGAFRRELDRRRGHGG